MTRKEAKEFIESLLKIRNGATDELALESIGIFPEWKPKVEYQIDERVRFGEQLYKIWQKHTSEEGKTPNLTPALYIAINEINKGTLEDPIPAVSGMLYKKDLYYVYNNVVYLCIRQDTEYGTVLQFTPDQLVDHYFKIVS